MLRPSSISRGVLILLPVALSSSWIGCGGGTKGQLPTAAVHGVVTYQGKPLSRGMITFIPAEAQGEGARNAQGTLDASGRYRLTTYKEGDGAIVGKHRVMIVSQEDVAPDMGKKFDEKGMPSPLKEPKSLIPNRYGNAEASGLAADVKRGSNEVNFDLKD